MKECTFELNGKPMSVFKVGATSFPAFSGLGVHTNLRVSACFANQGPIPPGEYYILDRESGGRLGWIRDLWSGRGSWFALYANDGVIDDETWCEQVKRGQFRLHPKGRVGISKGCIAIDQVSDYQFLRSIIKGGLKNITNSELKAYAKVIVK